MKRSTGYVVGNASKLDQ